MDSLGTTAFSWTDSYQTVYSNSLLQTTLVLTNTDADVVAPHHRFQMADWQNYSKTRSGDRQSPRMQRSGANSVNKLEPSDGCKTFGKLL